MSINLRLFTLFLIMTASCIGCLATDKSLLLETISLPPGFSISLYAENVPNARS
ncbi:secreted protein, partial [Candidatus Thiomargarita nelsonii]